MKKLRFSDNEITDILSEQGSGKTVSQISKDHGISEATFYNWKVKHRVNRDNSSDRVRTLEKENLILRNFCMDIVLKKGNLNDLLKL